MILQSVSVPCLIFLVVNFHTSDHRWAMWCCHVLVYATLAATVLAALPYLTGIRALLGDEPDAPGA